MMGDGIAVQPTSGDVYSPVDGEIVDVFPTKHAITLRSDEGAELLIHLGLETVNLKGEGFEIKVSPKDKIKKGDLIAQFAIDQIGEKGYNTITPIILLNGDQFKIDHSSYPSSVVGGKDVLIKAQKG
jgi:glucose-specific phosphotransferase system IIA component